MARTTHLFIASHLALLALAALALAGAGCTCGTRRPPTGGDAGVRADGAPDPFCVSGTRCLGTAFQRCVGGRYVDEAACGDGFVCEPSEGCLEASPCTLARVERSHVGCEYLAVDLPQPRTSSWPIPFGFPWSAQFGVVVSNPWPEPTSVRVERNDAPSGGAPVISSVLEVTVAGNSLQVIPLPTREVNGVSSDAGPASRSAITAAAYRITTSLPTAIYQFNPLDNEGIYSNDASLLVPSHSLDESYLVLGWPGQGDPQPGVPADNRSFVTIAAFGPTLVRVVPSTAVQGGDGVPALAAGQVFETRLDALGVLNLQGADLAMAGPTDFTGTSIEADRPIAVWSGVEAITISPPDQGFCCADHLEEQLVPRSALGAEYVAVRSRPRSPDVAEPDYFKILSLGDGTTVRTSLPGADAEFVLDRGEHRLVLSAESFTIEASSAVMVGQFLLSGEVAQRSERDPSTFEEIETHPQQGDPSFMIVPPVVQFRTEYRFLVPAGYERDYALVAAPAGTTLMLDGAPLACDRAPVGDIDGQAYEALHCRLAAGPHHLTADAPVGLVVEGWGPGVVSYGYTGGMDFEPVNGDCGEDEDCPGGEFCSGGVCVPDIILI